MDDDDDVEDGESVDSLSRPIASPTPSEYWKLHGTSVNLNSLLSLPKFMRLQLDLKALKNCERQRVIAV